jgi:hypothetical protein
VTVTIEPQKFIPDYEGREILNFRFQQTTSDPSVEGRGQWRSDTNRLVIHDGTTAQEVAWVSDLALAGSWDAEQTRDTIGTALAEGAGIDITVDDGANTITIASTISQYTDELARDAIGLALAAGNNIDITVDDGGDTITIAVESLTSADLTDFTAAVTSVAQDLINARAFKGTVDAVATTNITRSGTQTIDGVALVAGNTALLTGQTAPAENGAYVVAAGAWTRDTRADTTAELADATFLVDAGTDGKGELWTQTATVTTVDTTAQTWVKTGDANVTYTADGTSLELTSGTFSVKAAGITATHLAAAVAGAGLTGGAGSALAVGAGTGIVVNANDVAIDPAVVARKASGNLGNGSLTDTPFTHNLNTLDVVVSVKLVSTGRNVPVPWAATSVNVVTVYWPDTPTTDQYRITVVG